MQSVLKCGYIDVDIDPMVSRNFTPSDVQGVGKITIPSRPGWLLHTEIKSSSVET